MPARGGVPSRRPASRRVADPDRPPRPVRLGLLGGFALETDGDTVTVPLHAQRLVAFLALQGRPLQRAYVAGRLWTELSQSRAHASLRSTLWRIGRLPCAAVEATTTHLALAAGLAVDGRELEACASRVLPDGDATAAEVDLLVHAGDLLPDWYEDWVVHERERLRQLRLLALEAAADALVAERAYAEAVVAALAVVAADPLRESAYRLLIRAYCGEGNTGEALRQFGLFRDVLHRELGLEPSARMQELVHGIV